MRGIALDKEDRVISLSILRHFEASGDERAAYLKRSAVERRASGVDEDDIALVGEEVAEEGELGEDRGPLRGRQRSASPAPCNQPVEQGAVLEAGVHPLSVKWDDAVRRVAKQQHRTTAPRPHLHGLHLRQRRLMQKLAERFAESASQYAAYLDGSRMTRD